MRTEWTKSCIIAGGQHCGQIIHKKHINIQIKIQHAHKNVCKLNDKLFHLIRNYFNGKTIAQYSHLTREDEKILSPQSMAIKLSLCVDLTNNETKLNGFVVKEVLLGTIYIASQQPDEKKKSYSCKTEMKLYWKNRFFFCMIMMWIKGDTVPYRISMWYGSLCDFISCSWVSYWNIVRGAQVKET